MEHFEAMPNNDEKEGMAGDQRQTNTIFLRAEGDKGTVNSALYCTMCSFPVQNLCNLPGGVSWNRCAVFCSAKANRTGKRRKRGSFCMGSERI